MRRIKAQKRAGVIPILLAGCVGYLLGNAHIAAFRSTGLTDLSASPAFNSQASASQAVALRFPLEWKDASLATASLLRTAAMKLHAPQSSGAGASAAARQSQVALFSPSPMAPQAEADPDTTAQATFQTASAEDSLPVSQMSALSQAAASEPPPPQPSAQPAPQPAMSSSASPQMPAQKSSPTAKPAPKVAAAPRRPVNERPGYVLNDTQIASIKERLHLTPDQEQMWPAVEAALRNIAYSRAQQARGRGVPPGGGETQTAAIDPNAVQGLKSAAVPLILSFNSEQKEEVRNLAHVMGLDQLASQF
jgi:hypothetical protein